MTVDTPTNDERADFVSPLFAKFVEIVGGLTNDQDENMADMICDLGHLADHYGLNFVRAVEHGLGMWSAERRDHDTMHNDIATVTIETV